MTDAQEPTQPGRRRARVLAPERPWLWLALAVVLYAPFMDLDVGLGNVASDLAAIGQYMDWSPTTYCTVIILSASSSSSEANSKVPLSLQS